MSIRNEAKIRNPLIVAVREQLEHRALWMYLLCDEARSKGLDAASYAPDAIRRCGLYQGANLRKKAGGGDSLKGLRKKRCSPNLPSGCLRCRYSATPTTIWISTFTTARW